MYPVSFFARICLKFCYNNIIEEMIVIEVMKNHLMPLKKSDYTKIHNLRDTLQSPLTATSEKSIFHGRIIMVLPDMTAVIFFWFTAAA